jgi:transposase
MDTIQELVRLHRKGKSCQKVAALLGVSRTTERKYRTAIEKAGLLHGDASQLPDKQVLREVVAHLLPPSTDSAFHLLANTLARCRRMGAAG